MTAKTIILGAFAAMTLTTAATAATAAPTDIAASVDAGLGKTQVKTARADNPDQRYCIVQDPAIGSHISRRTCDTLSAWQDQGIDPRLLPRRR